MAAHILTSWLQDAYAMGQRQLKMLERCSKDFAAHPDIRSELQQHLIETRQQAEAIAECLQEIGAKPSAAKDVAGKPAGLVEDIGAGASDGTLVKDLLDLYAAEQFAYVCYSALAEAARHGSLDEIADICERIAEEEMAMAEWIEEQLPAVVTVTLTAHT